MHRSLTLLILLFFGSLGSAFAACPATSPTCGNPLQTGTSGSVLYAKAYGVKADGVTSDDAALKAAVTACSAAGTRLILPPGEILLTGAAGTIPLINCKLQGTGVPGATLNTPASFGTTFIITNATTPVFTGGAISNNTGGSGFSMEGFGAYWPGQHGNTVFPPFFTDLGNAQVDMAYIHDLQLINCYQCFYQQDNSDWWNWNISDSTFYGVLDGFNVYSTCDSWRMSNVHFTHGPWVLAFAPGQVVPQWYTVNGYINTAAAQNAMIHVRQTSGCGVTIVSDNITSYAFRYGILVDDGGRFINTPFHGSLDGVGTFVKLNGAANMGGTTFSGSGWVSCVVHFPTSGGDAFACSQGASSAPPAFDFGVGGAPHIKNLQGSFQGDFISSAGANITVVGADVGFGAHNNGTTDTMDYYCTHTTANPGGTGLLAQNLHCSPQGTTGAKMHGVVADVALNEAIVQGLDIINANEAIKLVTGATALTITGNTVRQTVSSASVDFSGGTGQALYWGNNVDKPAAASLTAGCNGAGSAVTGGLRGSFTPDTTSATTCTLTLPWVPYGGTGNCVFSPRQASALNAFKSGTKAWTITIVSGTATFSNLPISFDCTGIQ